MLRCILIFNYEHWSIHVFFLKNTTLVNNSLVCTHKFIVIAYIFFLYVHIIWLYFLKNVKKNHLIKILNTPRSGKIWPGPIFLPEPKGKIWVWVGGFRPGNKDGVNPYPTRKTMGRVGSTRGSHGSTRFSKDFFFFFFSPGVYIIMLGIKVLWEFFFFEWFGIWLL